MHALFTPRFQSWLHGGLTLFWVAMIAPTLLLWSNSVTYVVWLSVYAVIASHWSGFQGARAEKRVQDGATSNAGSS